MELAPEGTGYRARTRFSKFFNLPELMNLFKEVADIKTADQLNLPTPEVEYHNIVAQPTEHQQEMVKALSERASLVHSGTVDPSQDNMLKITSDGRKLGLDQRIVNQMLPDEPGTKVNQCVDNIMQIWRDGKADKLTQLVFCDISTPVSYTHLSEAEQIQSIDEAENVAHTSSAFSFAQNDIDHVLRLGGNTDRQRERVVAAFEKQKTTAEIAEILKTLYHGGNGLGSVSAWYADDGIHLSHGKSVRYDRSAQVISWESAAERIGELLESGQFASNAELAEAAGYERSLLATKFWNLYHEDVYKRQVWYCAGAAGKTLSAIQSGKARGLSQSLHERQRHRCDQAGQ